MKTSICEGVTYLIYNKKNLYTLTFFSLNLIFLNKNVY